MSPVVGWFILANEPRTALWLSWIAGISDLLDGWLARRFHWATQLGAYLDPAADKIMLGLIFLCFGEMGWVPWWLVAMVFGRDLMIVLGAAYIYRTTGNRMFPPSQWGKISTTIQILCSLFVLWRQANPVLISPLIPVILIWIMAAGTAWSGIHYFWLGVGLLKKESLKA